MTSLAPTPSTEISESPAREEARAYLHNLLCKNPTRSHNRSSHVSGGIQVYRFYKEEEEEPQEEKANPFSTPQDLNVILSETYEYRIPPSPPTPTPTSTTSSSTQPKDPTSSVSQSQPQPQPLLNITPRWLGLVVVPGAHILRIELEEFESQTRGRKS
ncbi:uncharacterized protein EAF02_004467 [Botrytis sinoallii]|uniref:uncharacterized protein n=1 Tax=Botrytis sinoallii TaxID=1463999 RepID=UPI0018FF5D07|nr:uncharacterized protein EAF02_004467 [Botrytis sinoallii]KAF7885958.1 hypothetical protein EAF02_004467 [Botrytis sinoallii]